MVTASTATVSLITAGFKDAFDGFSNNGLDNENNMKAGLQGTTGDPSHRGLFKVPTLRNIALTAPYMHDGRFNTLREVLNHYNEGIATSSTLSPLILEAGNSPTNGEEQNTTGTVSLHLTEAEKDAIIAFLHTLTDHQFITDDQFSSPFQETPFICRRSLIMPKLPIISISVLLLAVVAFINYESRLNGTLELQFQSQINGRHLHFNHPDYNNPGGEGERNVSIRGFRFYISNLKLQEN